MSYKYRVVEIQKENGGTYFEVHRAESELKYLCLDGSSTEFPIDDKDLEWEYVDEFACIGNAIDFAKNLKGQNVKSKKVVWSDS